MFAPCFPLLIAAVAQVPLSEPDTRPYAIPQTLTHAAGDIWWTNGTPIRGLWRLDAERLAAEHIRDVHLDEPPTPSASVALDDGVVVFAARDAGNGGAIYRTDGTPEGTFIVQDGIGHRVAGGSGYRVVRLRDRAYVLSANDIHGVVLWSTDGVSVERVVSWPPNTSGNAGHGPLSVVDDRLWFSVVADGVEAVVMSDGTTGGTDAVLPLVDLLSVSRVAPLDGRALLVADGRLHTIDPITGDRHTLGPDRFVGDPIALPAGGHAWAVRNTGRQREYWRTDGTEAGTELVFTTNIPLHRDDRAPAGIGAVLFAVDGDGNEVAWSEAGGQHTFGKCDVAGSVRSARLCVTRSEGQATLLALDGTTGVSRTIGSHSTSPNAPPLIFPDDDGGAIVVWPSTGSALVERIDAHGDTLGAAPAFLGRAPAPLTRYELHGGLDDEKIVLSRGEATAVVDVATGTEAFTEVKGDVIAADHHGYFSLHTSERESALRRYEVGSSEARVLASWDAPLSREWRRVGDAIALQVGIGPGADWWISDGTPEGTRLLVDVPTNANVVDLLAIEGGDMEALAVIDGQRMELWTLTPTGFEVTRRILGERLTEPRLLARGEHRFIAHMALGRSDYWRLRITELVADVDQPQLRYESAPTLDLARYVDGRFVLIGGDALVLTDDGVERIEASGVRDLVPFEGGAILSAEWPGLGVELLRWRDGAVELLRDLAPGPASSAPGPLIASGALLAFGAYDYDTGRELYLSDGTAEGTQRVTDIGPERFDGIHPTAHIAIGRRFVTFLGIDMAHGVAPYRLDLAGDSLTEDGDGCRCSGQRIPRDGSAGWAWLLITALLILRGSRPHPDAVGPLARGTGKGRDEMRRSRESEHEYPCAQAFAPPHARRPARRLR